MLKAISLQSSSRSESLPPQHIAVIGAGVTGLTTALVLLRAGYRVTVYADRFTPYNVSDVACAIWSPTFVGDPSKESSEQRLLTDQWARNSWNHFLSLPRKRYGISWTTMVEMFPSQVDTPRFASVVKRFQAAPDIGLPTGLAYKWTYRTMIIETPRYMAQLLHDVILAGGDVTVRHFASLDDLMQVPQRVVINCTGMGARDLFNDLDLRPVKGQIILHEPRKLRFTLGEGDYVAIPRSDALILGTLFDEQFDEDGPTDEATERIWLAVNRWLRPGDGVFGTKTYSLSREKIRTIMAGFRPYRSNGIRLQPEIIDRKVFIHNYGHGGGGITFSWGCSRDCLELVRKFALT